MFAVLTTADAGDAARLSAGFGWPHRMEDWQAMLRIGHGLGLRDAADELVATALWFPFGPDHATIGLVQVAPSQQGRGIGRRLMQAVIEAAGVRSMSLCATKEGAGLYASLGFVSQGYIVQMQGEMTVSATLPTASATMEQMRVFDTAGTGLDRRAMLVELARDGLAIVSDGIDGFALRRRFGRGVVIGPIIADSELSAVSLAASLRAPGLVRVDVPEAVTTLRAELTSLGLTAMSTALQMVRGDWPVPSGAVRCYGLASQALG